MAMAAIGTEDDGIARKLWTKFRNESVTALYTPFVVCLASGALDPQTFTHCVSQDVYFLRAFAQAYELAEQCADDDENKAAIRNLRKVAQEKLNNYGEIMREWGFELASESTSDSATVRYTDFLLATASGKIEGEMLKIATPFEKTKLAAYTLAAVGPCMRLCAFICKEIMALQNSDQSDHAYKKWIATLSSKKFEAAALEIEDLLEKLCVALTGEELEVIEKLYRQALKLELQFFCAQPMFQQTVVPFAVPHDPEEHNLSIFCDFDLTCTAIDSAALLAEIAIRTAPKVDVNVSETPLNRMPSADLRNTWDVLSKQYSEEYEKCIESIIAGEKVAEFKYEDLCRALEQVSEFEKRANLRVIQSGVLKGLNMEDIKRAGELLNLQDGCKGFFQEIAKREDLKTNVHIISYCWCGDLIRSAFSSGDMNFEGVHANELAYEENITSGDIIRKVESPMEKLQAFNENMNKKSETGKRSSVCIGGTVGDFLCLLKADIGIVIDPSQSLMRLGDHFGVSFVPLWSGLVKKQKECSLSWEGQSGTVYTVSSWAEIHAFILGT